MSTFKGKHILVTGGVKGIGRGTVDVFVREGGLVSVLDLDSAGLELEKVHRGNVRFYSCNVADHTQVKACVTQVIEGFGDIDVLVNNAGIQRYASVTQSTEEEWDMVMNVNLKSAFLVSKYVIPSMQRKHAGVIVNVSSVQAFLSQQVVAAYTTSKTGLLGLTRSIAVDYAPAIRCVAVCPGTIDTPMLQQAIQESPDPVAVFRECQDMHLVKKVGSAVEVGEFIAFLASSKASFITGQAYRIDGGLGVTIAGSKRSE